MTDILKFRTVVLIWLGLACVSPTRAELKPEDIYSAVLPSTVTLEIENAAGKRFVGSAFLAIADGLAVTAWHVVHDALRVEARFSNNETVKVEGVIDKDEKLDLALIRLKSNNRPRIKLNLDPPRIGSRIYVVGAPRGFDFSIGDGLISQIRTVDGVRYYQVSCPISPGDSGGPVLNDRGEVIGVMSWRKADAENVSFALPSSSLAGMNASLRPLPWPISPAPFAAPIRPPSSVNPLIRADAPGKTIADDNDNFDAFRTFLAGKAGKRVSITVQEDGRENHFSFEVPKAIE
jgi:S1-C subfamily serine protease